jgi:hypothetical protein
MVGGTRSFGLFCFRSLVEKRASAVAAGRCWAAPQDNRRIVIVVKQFRVSAKTVTVQGPERAVTLDGAGGQLNPSCAPGRPAAAELFAFADALVQRYYPPPLHRQ